MSALMKSLLIAAILAAMPIATSAQDFSALQTPGAVGLMRHAVAPGTGDPVEFDLEDCTTQRTLDERGRAQAIATGQALREAGVSFDAVWTSQWCRARNTARLLDIGPVTEVAALNSHFAGRGNAKAQLEEMREKLSALPTGARILLVSHQVNIRALTGRSTRSGEILIATREDAGALRIIGSALIVP